MSAVAIIVLVLLVIWAALLIAGRNVPDGSTTDETLLAFWIIVSCMLIVGTAALAVGVLAGWP